MIQAIKRYLLKRKIARYKNADPMSQEVLNRILKINGLNKRLHDLIERKMISKEDHYKRVSELLQSNNEMLEQYREMKKRAIAAEKELAEFHEVCDEGV